MDTEDITDKGMTVLEMIRDIYPVSFISIIIVELGYWGAYLVFNSHANSNNMIIERLLERLS